MPSYRTESEHAYSFGLSARAQEDSIARLGFRTAVELSRRSIAMRRFAVGVLDHRFQQRPELGRKRSPFLPAIGDDMPQMPLDIAPPREGQVFTPGCERLPWTKITASAGLAS